MDTLSPSVPDAHDEAAAQQNDEFRRTGNGGHVFLTSGVCALPPATIAAAREAVRTYDAFTEENDPDGRHDFGAFDLEGYTFLWRIDACNPPEPYAAVDPTTMRLLTLALDHEYWGGRYIS